MRIMSETECRFSIVHYAQAAKVPFWAHLRRVVQQNVSIVLATAGWYGMHTSSWGHQWATEISRG
jgi:hypothetical protein